MSDILMHKLIIAVIFQIFLFVLIRRLNRARCERVDDNQRSYTESVLLTILFLVLAFESQKLAAYVPSFLIFGFYELSVRLKAHNDQTGQQKLYWLVLMSSAVILDAAVVCALFFNWVKIC